jgi:hypothetical protein
MNQIKINKSKVYPPVSSVLVGIIYDNKKILNLKKKILSIVKKI